MGREKEKGFKTGQMEVGILESGKMTKQMGKASCSTLMVMCMKVIGKKIKQMAKVNTIMQTEPSIKASG